jgi:hypothetical protein
MSGRSQPQHAADQPDIEDRIPMDSIEVFDGHNDAVQFMVDYKSTGRDFLARSEEGHLDLPRAIEGHLMGGLFALHASPEHKPENDLIVTSDGTRSATPTPCLWTTPALRSTPSFPQSAD